MQKKRCLSFFLAIMLFVLLPLSMPASGAERLPESAYISGFSGHPQTYNLSCESRSAVDWAAFWGVRISETKFQARLPRSDNPDVGYVGDWNGIWGNIPPNSYGVHAEPVAALLRQYGLRARAGRGLKWDDLREEIAAGRPVIVWIIGAMWPGSPVKYAAADGQTVTVARYEHTMVLIGYDAWRVHVVDASTGWAQAYSLESFLTSWAVLGNMAVLGRGPKQASAPAPAPQAPAPQETANPPTPAAPSSSVKFAIWLPQIQKPVTSVTKRNRAASAGKSQAGSSLFDTYTVQPGDYLIALAKEWGINWRDLAALNHLDYPWFIYPGQVLKRK